MYRLVSLFSARVRSERGPTQPHYPPVVLRLEKLELLLDAVQRFGDGEFKGLPRGLVGRLAHRRTHTHRQLLK